MAWSGAVFRNRGIQGAGMVREDVRLSRTAAGLLVLVAALLLMPVGVVVRQVVAQVTGGNSPPRLVIGVDAVSDSVAATAAEFRVDESGAATYTIPLYGVPGTAGVMPQLSLTYSSQGGYGPLGKGWAISGMSSISRCRATREAGDFLGAATPDGNPRPIAFGADDRYCLDGQRLLPSPETCPAAGGQSGVALATERDSFQRICAYASGANGPAYFTAERKDGSMSWYGDRDQYASANRPDGYFETTSPINPAAALSWAQTRFQDSTGNYIDYLYLESPAGAGTGEHLLSEVRYTGKLLLPGQTGSPSAPYARIVFNYSARPEVQWSKGYASGGVLTQSRRLDSVTSCATIACATPDQARHYVLTYQPSTSGNALDTLIGVQECRDSTGAVCVAPTAFSWSSARHEFASLEYPPDLPTGSVSKLTGYKLGDIDGDGRLDVVVVKDGLNGEACPTEHLTVLYSNIDQSGAPAFSQSGSICTPAELGDFTPGEGSWHLFDYNGDGRDDLFLKGVNGQPWRLYPSQGRAGNGNFDTAQNLIAGLTIPSYESDKDQVQLVDFNGDGLVDIVYPNGGGLRTRYMERQSGGAYAWGAERAVVIDSASLNATVSRCNWADPDISDCWQKISGMPTTKSGFVQMTDFNGDSASDLMLRVTTTHVSRMSCARSGSQATASISQSEVIDRYEVNELKGTPKHEHIDPCLITTEIDRLHALVVSSQTATTVTLASHAIIGTTGDPHTIALADANGDGLTDIFLRETSNSGWSVLLSTGRGLVYDQVGVPAIDFRDQSRFVDVNGDGRADLLHVVDLGAYKTYYVRHSLPAGGYGASAPLPGGNARICEGSGCDVGPKVPMFADFDGDGQLDFLALRYQNNIDLFLSRSTASTRFMPRDVITGITNGLGARTEIAYAPLTNKDVYRRASGTRNVVNWGRGAPVMDLMAPTYVVARASSSSPQAGNPAAMAAVHYRYANGRVQSGGRGFLGFETVETIDPNQTGGHVVTTTRYAQHFPFIGMPTRTTRSLVAGAYTVPACLAGPMTSACFSVPGQAHAALGGSWISDSQKAWEASPNSLSTQAPLHVRTLGSEEALRDPFTGAQTSRVNTAFAYGSHGNVTQTIVDTFTGSETTPTGTVITASSYADNVSRWRLGRLASTTVTHRRPGRPDVVRTSAFGYQMSGAVTGQLNEERVQPGGAADLASTKVHQLDHYGNRLSSVTCAAPATGCDVNGFQFHPNTPQQVKRYARVEYDAWGRFPVATFEPFWTVGGGEERLTSRVLGRNVFGDAVDAIDANNVRSFSIKGGLGRDYYAWTQTAEGAGPASSGGVTSLTTYRWCNQVACPTGAKFRQQVASTGAPRQWTYFDVLGRPLMQAVETFNVGIAGQDVSATCTDYDIAGKPKRASHPFFLPGVAGADGPTAIEGVCAAPARLWTVTTYDALGRPVLVTAPDGSQASQGYAGLSTSATDPRGNTTTQQRNGKGELVATTDAAGLSTYYAYAADGNLLTVSRNVGGGNIVNSFQYDVLGRKVQQSDPDTGITTFHYNALGELVAQIDNLGQRIEHDIDGRGRIWRTRAKGVDGMTESESTFVFDLGAPGKLTSEEVTGQYTAWSGQANTALNTRRNLYYDALGRVYGGVIEADEHVLGFNTFYDTWGRVRLETDVSGRATKSQYGTRGHLVATCDVELTGGDQPGTPCATGTDTHRRILQTDAWGNVIREGRADNAALEITRTYWPLTGRLATICAGGSQCNLVNEGYGWDAAGNLSSHLKEQRYLESFSYDSLNRLIEGKLLMRDGVTVNQPTLANGYDALGNICSKNGVGYGYAGAAGCGSPGAQASMSLPVAAASASLAAAVPTALSPSRIERALSSGRNAANHLSHVPAAWRDIGVRHAPDLRSRRYSSDDDRPSWEREDEDWELEHGFVGPTFWSRSGGTTKQDTAGLAAATMSSGATNNGTGATTGIQSLLLGSGSPHAVSQTGSGAGRTTYAYDTRGNQVFRDAPGTVNDRTIVYSVDDKAHEILMGSGQRVRFWYGADGQRYKREDAGKITYYIGGIEMIVQGGAMTFKRYTSGVALQVVSSGIVHSTKFLFQDHLGSLVRIANPDGTLAERLDYSAFGDRRNPTNPASSGTASTHTPRGFTGHEYVDGTGIIHMNGRIYDQELGRFLQADPVIQAPDDTQTWNAYTYVVNNPLKYVDPSGNVFWMAAAIQTLSTVTAVVGPTLAQMAITAAAVAATAHVAIGMMGQASLQGVDGAYNGGGAKTLGAVQVHGQGPGLAGYQSELLAGDFVSLIGGVTYTAGGLEFEYMNASGDRVLYQELYTVNGRSFNTYNLSTSAPRASALDGFQTALDVAGFAPGIGIAADLLNGGIHLFRGNYGLAAMSMVGAVPLIGDAVAAGAKGARLAKAVAQSSKQGADLSRHLSYAQKYGRGGVKELQNGRVRYYGDIIPANKPGEMIGRRYVHEFDAVRGRTRGWHELLDQAGNVRQVRPELNNGRKVHHMFDAVGNYTGSW
ncbi:toxin TcdB middle/N-terminal domain-containing protein [Luteimonas sp. RIT-PG2_3]